MSARWPALVAAFVILIVFFCTRQTRKASDDFPGETKSLKRLAWACRLGRWALIACAIAPFALAAAGDEVTAREVGAALIFWTASRAILSLESAFILQIEREKQLEAIEREMYDEKPTRP